MLNGLIPRLYQETILATASQKNTLVVLPTGMGKTAIAMMLAAHRFKCFPNSKIIFLAPTKPLAQQHLDTFKKHFEIEKEKLVLFTGETAPEKRAAQWTGAKIVFATPQGLENDIINSKIDLAEVSLAIFDEAHRAVGDYAYNFVAEQYEKKARFPRLLALTASPGSDEEKIAEVCKNLFIEAIEIRTDESPDVVSYIHEIDIKWIEVLMPEEFKKIRKFLVECFNSKIREVKERGLIDKNVAIANLSKKELIVLQASLHAQISQGEKDFDALKGISLLAEAMKVHHGIELIETQGIAPLYAYMHKLITEARDSKVKAVKNLVVDENFKSAAYLCDKLFELKEEHPKIDVLKKIICEEAAQNKDKKKDIKIMLFNQYRDTASKLNEELNKLEGIKSKIFVGQLKKGETGLSQKKQKQVLDEFRSGAFNVLISTSIGEEGLDIPQVDLVIFYEPIPSAIRHIQRRGRTGRHGKGKVIVLVTKGTRDEAYRWSAQNKEKRMNRLLIDLQRKFNSALKKVEQTERKKTNTLDIYCGTKVKIYADHREKSSNVLKELFNNDVEVVLQALEVGDYVLSERVCAEIKTVPDFVDSIIDGRLLLQLKEIKQNFERPLVIIEGIEDIYSQRKVHPNAIRGMLATIAVSYRIPILTTKTARDTAALLLIIAKREQEEQCKNFSLHGEKKALTLKEQQEFVVSALPGIGPEIAKNLLKDFGSVKNILNADEKELKKVDKVGDKKARKIKEVINSGYEKTT